MGLCIQEKPPNCRCKGYTRQGEKYKFTNCPVRVNLNEQEDGSWEVTTCNLEYEGYKITNKIFLSNQQSQKLSEDDKEFLPFKQKLTNEILY